MKKLESIFAVFVFMFTMFYCVPQNSIDMTNGGLINGYFCSEVKDNMEVKNFAVPGAKPDKKTGEVKTYSTICKDKTEGQTHAILCEPFAEGAKLFYESSSLESSICVTYPSGYLQTR